MIALWFRPRVVIAMWIVLSSERDRIEAGTPYHRSLTEAVETLRPRAAKYLADA